MEFFMIIIFSIFVVGGSIFCASYDDNHLNEVKNIVSIQDNSDISGSFFLGMGSVDSETYYYFYQKNTNGSYSLEKIRTDFAEVFELENISNPRVEKWSQTKNIFYVPKNTVIKEFTLDAK